MNPARIAAVLIASLAPANAAWAQVQADDPSAAAVEKEKRLFDKWGPGVPFAAGIELGASFLLSERAGLPVPGAPPRVAPTYDQAFGTGVAAGLRFSYTFRSVLSAFAYAGLESYPGQDRDEGQLGPVSYGDMIVVPCLVGLRLGAPLGLDSTEWLRQGFAPRVDGLFPFLEAGVGVAWRSSVELEPVGTYWEAASVFSARAAAGVEIRYEGISLAAAAVFAYHSEPPESLWYAEAEATMALAADFSLSFRF